MASPVADPVQAEDSWPGQEALCLGKQMELRGRESAALASVAWLQRDPIHRERRAQVQHDCPSLLILGSESEDSCMY